MQFEMDHSKVKKPTIIFMTIFAVFVLSLFITSVQAQTVSITLESKQNIEFTNSSGSSFVVSSTGYYDYAVYDLQSTLISYAKSASTSLTVATGRRVVITNPNSTSITISGNGTAFNPLITQNEALYKFTLLAGMSYEFTNTSTTTDRNITNNNASFDYVKKDATGGVSWGNNVTYTSLGVLKGGTTKVTINSNLSCWYPRELYLQDLSYVEIQETPLYEFTLQAGKNYEFTNTSTTANRYITNNNASFDYIKKDASGGISWGNNVTYNTLDVLKSGTTKVTINSNLSCWYPREPYLQDLSYVEIQETPLYEFTLQAGKNYEFTNTSTTTDRNISNSNASYDYVKKDASGGVSWGNNVTYTSLGVLKGGTTKVTINSNLSCWYPRELYLQDLSYVEIPETALYEFTIMAGKNYEFTNTSTTANRYITNNNASFDYVKKDASGGMSWGNNAIYNSIDVLKSGTTKVTANANLSWWYPREVYKQGLSYVEIPKTALYEFTMSVGKTYEFTNSSSLNISITNSSSSSTANRYDYHIFNNNPFVSIGKSAYGSILTYAGGHTIIYIPGTSNINGWYPREEFESYMTFSETNPLNFTYPTDIVCSHYQEGVNTQYDTFYGASNTSNGLVEITDLSPFLVGKDTDMSHVSLPRGSYVVLGFRQPVINMQGLPDLIIKGTGAAYEEADVFVSSLDGELHFLGTVTETNEYLTLDFDALDITEPIIAVMLIGKDEGGSYPGFDVVEAKGFTDPNIQVATADVENAYDIIRNFLLGRLPSKWSAKSPMVTARTEMGTAIANGKIYAVGGKNYLTDGILDSIEEYNPATNTWYVKAGKIQSPRLGFGTAAANNKIYIIGGSDNGCTDKVEEYDPNVDSCTYKASINTARYGLAAIEMNGKIYAVGGVNENGFLGTVEEYDPSTNQWTYKKDMPTARAGLALTAYNGLIYAIGGHNGDGQYLNTVEVFNPTANTWTAITSNLPAAGTGFSVGVMDGRIYVIGGWNGDYIKDIAEYNIGTGGWRMWEGLKTPRTGTGAVAAGNMIYVIGGSNFDDGGYSNKVNVFEGGY